MSEKLFHVGIKGLIVNPKNQILLMQVNKAQLDNVKEAYWDIPGGRIQKNHTVVDTLRREIEEETGLTKLGKPEFFTAVISNIQIPLKDGSKVGLVLMVYKIPVSKTAKIILSNEHVAYKWLPPKEAAKLLVHKYPAEFTAKIK